MTEKTLTLKVAEAVQDDVNKGIVRIDASMMRQIDVRPGDVVEIEGERKTVAIADRSHPGDLGQPYMRMDGLTRRNAKTSIGEQVKIRKADVKPAKKVSIAPAKKGIVVKASPAIFKQMLLGRAVTKGDIISLGGARKRRSTMTGSPFYDEVFSMMDESSLLSFGFADLKFVVSDTNPKGSAILTDQTEITLNPEAVEVEEDSFEVTYEDIGGLEEEISKIREMVELPLKHPEIFERLGIEPPKGVLLHGPPGTGKTLLAKAVAAETNSHFITINGPEIMSKYYGQSEENLRKKFEEAQQNAPSIIFIDEIDAIATKREETKGEVERRVVAQLLTLMDGLKSRGKIVVIGATNVPNMIDPALRRPGRFDRELEINPPTKEGRLIVLKIHTRNMPLTKDVKLEEFATLTHGFVGADLASLAREAAMVSLRRVLPTIKYNTDDAMPPEILEKIIISRDDFLDALRVVRPSALREVLIEVPNVHWDDIGGLDDVKQKIKEAVEWPLKHPEAFKRMGTHPPKGILIYGPPGTGKTMLAKAVATESEANFISVKGPELLSKWVGESEKAVREIFKKARISAPSIIFFDEIDSLAPRRSGGEDGHVSERVVNQLLTEIDGVDASNDVVIIGATNRPDLLDTALLRPGRFDRIILTPAPDKKTRAEIFKVHTKNMPLAKDVDLVKISDKSEGFAGADIEAICREAAIHALRQDIDAKIITQKDFEAAMQMVKPSVSKEIEKEYEALQDKFSQARAAEMKAEKPIYFG